MAAGEVLTKPSKRFADDDENLAIADLNELTPVCQLGAGSIGSSQFIHDDMLAIIQEQAIGITVNYLFEQDFTLATGTAPYLKFITDNLAVPEATVNDTLRVFEPLDSATGLPLDLDIQFYGLCAKDGFITLYAYTYTAPFTIPAGTQLPVTVFTPRRLKPGQGNQLSSLVDAPALVESDPSTTGYLVCKPGYPWQDELELQIRRQAGETLTSAELAQMAITTEKLDQTCQSTFTIPDHSVGRREIDPEAVGRIVAGVIGGDFFNGKTTHDITFPPGSTASGVLAALVFTITGAAVGQIPVVMGVDSNPNNQDFAWGGQVTATDTVALSVQNRSAVTLVLKKGTKFQGRLIG